MISVSTPAACAREMIAGTLPPSDLARYQIHIERPFMGVVDALERAGPAKALSTSTIRSEKKAAVAVLGRPSDKCIPPARQPVPDVRSGVRDGKPCKLRCSLRFRTAPAAASKTLNQDGAGVRHDYRVGPLSAGSSIVPVAIARLVTLMRSRSSGRELARSRARSLIDRSANHA